MKTKILHKILSFQTFTETEGMANIAQQRIQREFREVVKSKEIAESGVQLELVRSDAKILRMTKMTISRLLMT